MTETIRENHERFKKIQKKVMGEICMNIEDFKKVVDRAIQHHDSLKARIVDLLFQFTDETCYPKSEMYPYALKIMENVLIECLEEVRALRGNK